MFHFLRFTPDKKNCLIFDTSDFSIETHSTIFIEGLVRRGIVIKGISISRSNKITYTDLVKNVIYVDNRLAIIDSTSSTSDYLHIIEVHCLGEDTQSWSTGYNIWLKPNVDKIKPEVEALSNSIYEIKLFGNDIGFSICVMHLGNGVVKPVYRDLQFISKRSKLLVDTDNGSINFRRI